MKSLVKKIARIALITILILQLPLLAMLFSDEVSWDLGDFAVGGILLFGAGLAYELIASRSGALSHKVTVGVVVALILFLIWAELAVGIFGTPWVGS